MGLMAPFSVTFYGFLVVSLFFKEAESCPKAWTFYNGHCYGLFNDLLTWNDAEIDCQKKKVHLASIHYMEEMVHLSQYIRRNIREYNNVWVGLHIDRDTKNWEWVDQTSNRYLPWDDGEPNNFMFNEDCVELSAKKDYLRWNDRKCSKKQPYICKMSAI